MSARDDTIRRDSSPGTRNQFRRASLGWSITYRGESVEILDSKGLQFIARLLELPGRRVHVLELARGVSVTPNRENPTDTERVRKAVTNRIRDSIARITDRHPALGEHFAQAIRTGTTCSYAPGMTVEWDL